jgi:hypothetical protein
VATRIGVGSNEKTGATLTADTSDAAPGDTSVVDCSVQEINSASDVTSTRHERRDPSADRGFDIQQKRRVGTSDGAHRL